MTTVTGDLETVLQDYCVSPSSCLHTKLFSSTVDQLLTNNDWTVVLRLRGACISLRDSPIICVLLPLECC